MNGFLTITLKIYKVIHDYDLSCGAIGLYLLLKSLDKEIIFTEEIKNKKDTDKEQKKYLKELISKKLIQINENEITIKD